MSSSPKKEYDKKFSKEIIQYYLYVGDPIVTTSNWLAAKRNLTPRSPASL